MATETGPLPSLYIPHGGGPCFFMDWTLGPADTWDRMAAWLGGLIGGLPSRPKAILVISAHWECPVPTVSTAAAPDLIFDYYNFPEHTYRLSWPAPGDPALAAWVETLLEEAGLPHGADAGRGFDHGVFVPLKVALPEADIPTVALSLQADLDPAFHLRLGRALAPLRDEGVLILGSGMSYHNLGKLLAGTEAVESAAFDAWLTETVEAAPADREARLKDWAAAPAAREAHPREEHLAPIFVAAGAAAEGKGRRIFTDQVMGAQVSAYAFG